MASATLLPFQPDAMTPSQLGAVSFGVQPVGRAGVVSSVSHARW
jgi:hypothetical protein